MPNSYQFLAPNSPEQWQQYYQLRYTILRGPWGAAPGTEHLPDDPQAIHVLALHSSIAVGCGRLHLLDQHTGQIRCMAVAHLHQGLGIGQAMMQYLEQKAKEQNIQQLVLDARELAVEFYQKQGYQIIAPSYLLFGQIKHWRMQKILGQ
jgi:ribosomal protein S18 acetylase RimI-like enzyme